MYRWSIIFCLLALALGTAAAEVSPATAPATMPVMGSPGDRLIGPPIGLPIGPLFGPSIGQPIGPPLWQPGTPAVNPAPEPPDGEPAQSTTAPVRRLSPAVAPRQFPFDIKCPEGWNPQLLPANPTVVLAFQRTSTADTKGKSSPAIMVTFVRRFEPLADDALDGLAQRAAVAMVSTNFAKSTGKLLTFEAATMAGNKAMKIIATGLVGDGRVHQTSFMIMAIHNGNPVGVQFSCDVDMYDKVLPEVNALVQTLKWRD